MSTEDKKAAEKKRKKKYYQENRDRLNSKSKKYYQENKENRATYYQENREKIILRCSKYQKENRHVNDKASKKWRINNPEKVKEHQRVWRQNNLEKHSATQTNYRAKKLNATPAWADLEAIAEIYKNRPEGYHVDHIIPLQGKIVCGLHVHWNLQYLTAEENLKKSNKLIGV